MSDPKKLLTKRMIGNAVDMIQVIRDEIEHNFVIDQENKEIKYRDDLLCSSLSILTAYLLRIREEVGAE